MKNVQDIYPLSPMQELMLVHSLGAAQSSVLFNQLVYIARGALDVDAFERAWRELVARHAILRTAFVWEKLKEPVQVVRESATLEFEKHDWRATPASDHEKCLNEFLERDRARGFKLTHAPLMRVALIQIADDVHYLVWSSHHLILDRWCIPLVLNELAALYRAQMHGEAIPPDTRRPFRDYIAWLQKQDRAAAESFWRAELREVKPTSILPPAAGASEYRHAERALAESTTKALRRLSAQNQLTLNTLLLGMWTLVLSRWSASNDLVLGVTVSGRPPELPGVETMLGSFINNLPLRARWRDDDAVWTWLMQLQRKQLAQRQFEYVSPVALQEWAELDARAPLFENLFLFQAAIKSAQANALDLRPFKGGLTTNFPLTLAAMDEGERVLLWLGYDAARFDENTATEILTRLQSLLEHLANDAAQTVGALARRIPADKPWRAHTTPSRATQVPAKIETVSNSIEARLLALWSQVLGKSAISANANFFELGGASLQALQLIAKIEKEFERKLPVYVLFQAPTIRALAQAISDGVAPSPWQYLVPIQPAGTRPPFFLVHHGAGGTYGFANIPRYLDPAQPLYGIQESGGRPGEASPASIEAMAREYVREVRAVQPRGPYTLGGFCFGGIVAFEMAQQLQRAGEQVKLLVLVDATSPDFSPNAPRAERAQKHAARMATMNGRQKIGYVLRRIARRVYWETRNRVYAARDAVWMTIYHINTRLGLPVSGKIRGLYHLQWNAQLLTRYAAQPYRGNAILIRSEQPDLALDYGWNAWIQNQVTLCPMQTQDHLGMLMEPQVKALGEYLQKHLNNGRE
ncbi:MAG: hypothetical protein HY868_08225 [Chloroflexi bacterium]|nr:hypothetical protein [Chloroflexota bacterium]